jgi:DNA segregation ATPase FtsK/SpoIIIE, S-DNA-T family
VDAHLVAGAQAGANPPTIQHATATTVDLPGGGSLHRVGFVTRMGIDPADYRGLEPKLATPLDAAPFVSVIGWPADPASPGSRHPQAFAVCWSTAAVSTAPQDLSPYTAAPEWVLAGQVNAAFDAARLARPELVTRPLPDSRR